MPLLLAGTLLPKNGGEPLVAGPLLPTIPLWGRFGVGRLTDERAADPTGFDARFRQHLPTIDESAFSAPTFEEAAARAFKGLSPLQRVVCRLFDGLPPEGAATPALYEQVLGRPWGDDLRTPKQVVLLMAGRGSGKSLLAALRAVYVSANCSLAGLAPGESAHVVVVAPVAKLADQVLKYSRGFLLGSGLAAKAGATAIEFRRGSTLSVHAASSGGLNVRGKALAGAVLDEAGFFRHATGNAVTARMIVDAITYRLRPGAQILLTTTPWVRAGYWYDLYDREFGRSERALVLRAPSYALNPAWTPPAENTSEAARLREVEAEPVEDEEAGLCTAVQFAKATEGRDEGDLPVMGGGSMYQDALDLAGGGADKTAYAIGHLEGADGVVVDLVRSWGRDVPLEARMGEISTLRRRYRIRADLACDQFAFEAAAALGRVYGVSLRLDTTHRASMYGAAGELLRDARISLPRSNLLRSQFMSISLHAAGGGTIKVEIPRDVSGGHCDEAVAVVLLCSVLRANRYVLPIGAARVRARSVERSNAAAKPDAGEVVWGGGGLAAILQPTASSGKNGT